jgi:hypothetical protein
MKTLITLLRWECDLNAFFTDQITGRTSIELSFGYDDFSMTELIVKKSKFSSFIICQNTTKAKTLFDMLESVYESQKLRLLKGSQELKLYIDLVNAVASH